MQWLQDTNQSNVDNLNNVRREASRHCRKKKKEYLRDKIDDFQVISKIKNIRDIIEFMKGYHRRTDTVKDEKGDLVTDCHSILNVHGVSAVRQIKIHTPEPRVREPSAFELEITTGKLKRHKSPYIDQIPSELVKALGRTILFGNHKIINSIWKKESIIVSNYKKGDTTYCSNYRGISLLSSTYKILTSILLSRFTSHAEEIIGDHQGGFLRNRSSTDHIFCIREILKKKMRIE